MDHGAVARALLAEARETNERRLLVLSGERERCYDAVRDALDAVDVPLTATTLVGERDVLPCERVEQARAGDLLGTTRRAVVFDAHDALRPNALGSVVGAVDGGGLLVLLAPPLSEWPDRRDAFDERLTVPPHDANDVGGRFRRRLVETLRAHPGVAVVDADRGVVERDGLTDPAPRRPPPPPEPPADRAFPRAAYDACLTDDQVDAVRAFEALREPGNAVVVEADRGRGKSSAAGIAAGALAAEGADVLVTAPGYRSAREAFVRAAALLSDLDALAGTDRDDDPHRVEAEGGGLVRFASPADAVEQSSTSSRASPDNAVEQSSTSNQDASHPDDAVEQVSDGTTDESSDGAPDVVVVDEAAALPVARLERLLAADRVAFTTTVHGYEGAGRGFSVRFRDHLAESDHAVTDCRMADPIRYAAGDPVEVWAFRALLLDAAPPVEPLVADATPGDVAARELSPSELLADEHLLREAFGLLVLAHYRTEPDDLARLLDAPNISVRALLYDGHVVAVALLAREGALPETVRRDMHDGGRVRGHMLPDVLVSQLRDEDAGIPAGDRVLRIATHHAVRSRGLGSRLLDDVRAAAEADDLDWVGVGYGATPELLSFWRANGFSTLHLATTRNERSGEYSAIMLSPLTDAGRDLRDRHADWFADRVAGVLSDPLDDLDPDVARAALRSVDADVPLDLSPYHWRVIAGAAYGPGLFDVAPAAFREVAVRQLIDPADPDALSAREERLLVCKVLQGRPWDAVADRLGYHSAGQCMRALGDAFQPLVDAYGDETALAVRKRYAE